MRLSKSFVQRPANGDPNFGSVRILLPFDGTNGATATTDLSSFGLGVTLAACSLTHTGPKFGSASLSVGTTSVVSASLPAAGTGEFILEGWFYWNAVGSTQVLWVVNDYTIVGGYEVYTLADGSINVYGNNGAFTLASATSTITAGAWHHIAFKRNASNTASLWVNGVSVASGSYTSSILGGLKLGSQTATIGLVGKMDDFRATHGTDRGASVTVPTAAFPTST